MTQKSDKRRQEIIIAARDLFAEKGYHSTTISDITRRLNMAHGTFYIYFQSKAEIFSDIVEDYIEKITNISNSLTGEVSNISEFKDLLQQYGEESFNLVVEDPKMAYIIFFQVSGTDKVLEKKILQLINKIDKMAETLLIDGINKRFLKASMDTETVAKALRGMLFAGLNDIASNEISMERKERWINSIIRILLDGLT